MKKAVPVPIDRLTTYFDENPGWWAPEAYQGPGGLYAIRETDDDHTFQVYRFTKGKDGKKISEPFMTPRGAKHFAQRLAEGGSPDERIS